MRQPQTGFFWGGGVTAQDRTGFGDRFPTEKKIGRLSHFFFVFGKVREKGMAKYDRRSAPS
jgi:hypothetical protein